MSTGMTPFIRAWLADGQIVCLSIRVWSRTRSRYVKAELVRVYA